MLSLSKNNSFLSFQSPIFHSKINNFRETFFERVLTYQSERTFRGRGAWVHVKRPWTNKGRLGQKFEILSKNTF